MVILPTYMDHRSYPKQIVGIALKVASTLAFTAMATFVKLLSDRYPVGEIVFFRSFFELVPVLVWLIYRGSLTTILHTRQLPRHLFRAATRTVAMFSGFTALSMLPIADAIAIGYAMPLLTVVLAVVLLGEKVRIYRWSAVVVGLIGVLVILSDYVGVGSSPERNATGALVALAGASFAALAATQARILVRSDSAATVVAYSAAFIALVSLATLSLGWVVPGVGDAALLILTGVFGGIGQVLVVTSFRFGDASTIAPFDYTSMVWVLAVSLLVFGTWPTGTVLLGSAIVISAGLFVIYREHRLGIDRAQSKRVQMPTTPLT